MRTTDRLIFCTVEETYDSNLSDYIKVLKELKTIACHVSDLGLERSMQVFGDYEKQRKVARLDQPFREQYDIIKHDGSFWKVVTKRLNGCVLYLEQDSVGDYGEV